MICNTADELGAAMDEFMRTQVDTIAADMAREYCEATYKHISAMFYDGGRTSRAIMDRAITGMCIRAHRPSRGFRKHIRRMKARGLPVEKRSVKAWPSFEFDWSLCR